MKITAIRTYPLEAELKESFGFSQWEYSRRTTMLVEISTDSGVTGWGEAYGPSKPAASAVADFFAPLLIGRDPRDTEALWHFLFARSIDYGQKGTLLAALVLGIFDTAGKYLLADAGGFFIYAVTVVVLLIKPAGFYGRE